MNIYRTSHYIDPLPNGHWFIEVAVNAETEEEALEKGSAIIAEKYPDNPEDLNHWARGARVVRSGLSGLGSPS